MTSRAQHDIGVHPLAPEVEKAVREAHLLRVLGVAVDRERQRLGGRQQFVGVDDQLDFAGRQVRVDRLRRPLDDRAGERHDAFEPQPVHLGKQRRRHVDHALRDAVMVAQIDEQQLAVVALAVHPAGEAGRHARVVEAKGAASMGAIGVHRQGPAHSSGKRGTRHGSPALVKKPGRAQRCGARSRHHRQKSRIRVLFADRHRDKRTAQAAEIPAIPCKFPASFGSFPVDFPARAGQNRANPPDFAPRIKHQGKFPC